MDDQNRYFNDQRNVIAFNRVLPFCFLLKMATRYLTAEDICKFNQYEFEDYKRARSLKTNQIIDIKC